MHSEKTQTNRIISRYEKIALDIAFSITNHELLVGSFINGRSTLAAKYGVSPETIRRAIKLLEELSVVESVDKVGVRICSVSQANLFIQDYHSKDKILTLRDTIGKLVNEREILNAQILEKIDDIIEQSLTLRNMGIIYPLEYKIDAPSHIIGKRIGELRFWEHTGVTIIGINRNGKLSLSPGPNHIFEMHDVIVYVGNVINISEKLQEFIQKKA